MVEVKNPEIVVAAAPAEEQGLACGPLSGITKMSSIPSLLKSATFTVLARNGRGITVDSSGLRIVVDVVADDQALAVSRKIDESGLSAVLHIGKGKVGFRRSDRNTDQIGRPVSALRVSPKDVERELAAAGFRRRGSLLGLRWSDPATLAVDQDHIDPAALFPNPRRSCSRRRIPADRSGTQGRIRGRSSNRYSWEYRRNPGCDAAKIGYPAGRFRSHRPG